MANFGSRPADLFDMLVVAGPDVSFANEPLDVGPGPVGALLVAAMHDHDDGIPFEEPGAAPDALKGEPVIDVEGEMAPGAQGAGGGLDHAAEILAVGDVVQGIELAGDEVNGLGEAEIAHVGVDDFDGESGLLCLLASDAAHFRGEVHGVDANAELGEENGEGSRPAAEFAGGFHIGQERAEDALAGHFEGAAQFEEMIVVFG